MLNLPERLFIVVGSTRSLPLAVLHGLFSH